MTEEEREKERQEEEGRNARVCLDIVVVVVVLFGRPIKIDRGEGGGEESPVHDGRGDNLSSAGPHTILRNRRASRSRCSQKLAVREIDYAMFGKVCLLAIPRFRVARAHPRRYLCSLTARCVVNLSGPLPVLLFRPRTLARAEIFRESLSRRVDIQQFRRPCTRARRDSI